MKSFLIAAFLLFVAGTGNAQNCKYDYQKADPITGKSTKSINCKLARSWRIAFGNTDGALSTGLYIVLPGDQSLVIQKGDSVNMRTEAGDVITLYAAADARPTVSVVGAGGYRQFVSVYNVTYDCGLPEMKKLAKSPLTAIRIFFGETPATLDEIKGKMADNIRDAAYCIYQ